VAQVLTVRYGVLGLRSGERLLDFGCGGGRHSFEAMRWGAVTTALDSDPKEARRAADWVKAMLDEDKKTAEAGGQGHVVLADGIELPFPAASFDRVVASEVLEHVGDDKAVLAELSRVTRPSGTLAVSVPRWYPEAVCWGLSRAYHNAPGGHVRIYRRRQLVARLRDAGFEPYSAHHAHALHSPYWWLRCALGDRADRSAVVDAYYRLLVWDIEQASPLTRWPEAVLNPLVGKSLVVYARRL
jgi:SAM-dependent methyltransferase